MTNITIAWIVLPFSIGLIIYLIPKLSRWLALGTPMVSFWQLLSVFLYQHP